VTVRRDLFGIKNDCHASAALTEALYSTIKQIRARRPTDWARIAPRIQRFGWLSAKQASTGTVAEVFRIEPKSLRAKFDWDSATHEQLEQHERERDSYTWDVAVLFARSLDEDMVAVVAHELGHVATTRDDFDRRDGLDGEWASESCADYYAYRWGFARAIRRHQRSRNLGHHGTLPGGIITIDGIGTFKMTRNFHLHPVENTPKRLVKP
jgi:hypothetical protein